MRHTFKRFCRRVARRCGSCDSCCVVGNPASGDQDQHHCDGAGGGAGVAVVDWCGVLGHASVRLNYGQYFLGVTMVYFAPMELQTQIEKLEARIAALEKMLDGGDATFDTIICKSWRVVDKDGKQRLIAGTFPNGHASVLWFDKDGKLRIAAATDADGDAKVSWLDKDGNGRIIATTNADGDAGVSWLDKDEKVRIVAATNADGSAGVWWIDKDKEMRIDAVTRDNGSASVSWFDKDGKRRIVAFTLPDGQAGVQLVDKDEWVRISAGTNADGTVELPTEDLKK